MTVVTTETQIVATQVSEGQVILVGEDTGTFLGSVPAGYVALDGVTDVHADVVHGLDANVGHQLRPVKTIGQAIALANPGLGGGGRAGRIRLAGAVLALIDNQPSVTGQAGPSQTFGNGGARIDVPASTVIEGGGHNDKSSTGKACTWIMDTLAADGLVKLGQGSGLMNLAITNRSTTGYGLLVVNNQAYTRRVLIQGCGLHGLVIQSNSCDGCLFDQLRVLSNAGVGIYIQGSAANDGPNAMQFTSVKAQGNQLQQWLYDSTDQASGNNAGGKCNVFSNCSAQGPGGYSNLSAPLIEIRGGMVQDWVDTFFEMTGSNQAFPALKIDAGQPTYTGRNSYGVAFVRPRFHTLHTSSTIPVQIDHATGCTLEMPLFDIAGGFAPSTNNPFVQLGANTKGCRVRIGPQLNYGSLTSDKLCKNLGTGNDVQVWDDSQNKYVTL
jgi:hypothetical protein